MRIAGSGIFYVVVTIALAEQIRIAASSVPTHLPLELQRQYAARASVERCSRRIPSVPLRQLKTRSRHRQR